ncbi:hypothetical protein FOCC_FOCC002800 [Frankliniella occidentalis]|nr:hypothetical protein FOCC_FOCC002800 [Frankliniella occidentalis]
MREELLPRARTAPVGALLSLERLPLRLRLRDCLLNCLFRERERRGERSRSRRGDRLGGERRGDRRGEDLLGDLRAGDLLLDNERWTGDRLDGLFGDGRRGDGRRAGDLLGGERLGEGRRGASRRVSSGGGVRLLLISFILGSLSGRLSLDLLFLALSSSSELLSSSEELSGLPRLLGRFLSRSLSVSESSLAFFLLSCSLSRDLSSSCTFFLSLDSVRCFRSLRISLGLLEYFLVFFSLSSVIISKFFLLRLCLSSCLMPCLMRLSSLLSSRWSSCFRFERLSFRLSCSLIYSSSNFFLLSSGFPDFLSSFLSFLRDASSDFGFLVRCSLSL